MTISQCPRVLMCNFFEAPPLERRSTASHSEVMTSATYDLPQCSYRGEGNAANAKNPKEDRCQNEEKMISRRRERSALFGKAPAHEVPRKSPCRGGDKQSPSKAPRPAGGDRGKRSASAPSKSTQQDADDRGRPGENGAEKPTHSWSRIPGVVSTPYTHAWTDKIDHALCRRYFCWERCSGETISPQQELYLLVSEINWYSFEATWAVFARW
jgi:hypothetical protein